MLLKAMLVETLYFNGCPNYRAARGLVERVAAEIGVDSEIRMVEVPDVETAERLAFSVHPRFASTAAALQCSPRVRLIESRTYSQ